MHRAVPLPPLPIVDADSAPFWAAARTHEFLYRHCTACKRNHFYPRHACPYCWTERCEWRAARGRGRVHSYTVVHHSDVPAFHERLPYIVAVVELDEGLRVIANVLECTPEVIHIGMPVEIIYERLTDDITLPQFRPGRGGL